MKDHELPGHRSNRGCFFISKEVIRFESRRLSLRLYFWSFRGHLSSFVQCRQASWGLHWCLSSGLRRTWSSIAISWVLQIFVGSPFCFSLFGAISRGVVTFQCKILTPFQWSILPSISLCSWWFILLLLQLLLLTWTFLSSWFLEALEEEPVLPELRFSCGQEHLGLQVVWLWWVCWDTEEELFFLACMVWEVWFECMMFSCGGLPGSIRWKWQFSIQLRLLSRIWWAWCWERGFGSWRRGSLDGEVADADFEYQFGIWECFV